MNVMHHAVSSQNQQVTRKSHLFLNRMPCTCSNLKHCDPLPALRQGPCSQAQLQQQHHWASAHASHSQPNDISVPEPLNQLVCSGEGDCGQLQGAAVRMETGRMSEQRSVTSLCMHTGSLPDTDQLVRFTSGNKPFTTAAVCIQLSTAWADVLSCDYGLFLQLIRSGEMHRFLQIITHHAQHSHQPQQSGVSCGQEGEGSAACCASSQSDIQSDGH